MKMKTIRHAGSLKGKKVLLRVAYDITLKKEGTKWVIGDDTRIRATLPTIRYLLKEGASVVILSWLKRPGGKVVDKYRMDPVAAALSKLLKKKVKKLDDCIGPKVLHEIEALKPGKLLMLENVRFYPEEEQNNKRFAKLLVQGTDLIVFDAFAQAHRVHASTVGILKYRPVYAGLLLEKELKELSKVSEKPKKPLVLILGGAKISDKINVLQKLIQSADKVLIGGGVANAFLKAQGVPIADSFIEDVFVDKARRKPVSSVKIAKRLLKAYPEKIIMPTDFIAARRIDPKTMTEHVDIAAGEQIKPHWMFLDIGPATSKHYEQEIKKAKTIFWNGPMGVFEHEHFAKGTKKVARAVARSKGVTVLGGGDTEVVVDMCKLKGKFTHVSTGGGASLEFLSGHVLPAVKELFYQQAKK